MKQVEDNKTVDMLGGEPKKRGRKPKYANAAERQAAWRERHDLVQLNISVKREVLEGFLAYMDRQEKLGNDVSQGAVVAKLIQAQLLRRR